MIVSSESWMFWKSHCIDSVIVLYIFGDFQYIFINIGVISKDTHVNDTCYKIHVTLKSRSAFLNVGMYMNEFLPDDIDYFDIRKVREKCILKIN